MPISPPIARPTRPGPFASALSAVITGIVLVACPSPATAQSPFEGGASAVYLDDSTRAAETLAQLDQLIQTGSLSGAAQTFQSLLETEGDRLLPSPDEPDLYRPVRDAIHDAMLARPELLAVYATTQQPAAEAMLDAGDHAEVEHSRFLTPAGFEAALRVAQEQLEATAFAASIRTLRQLERHPAFDRRTDEAMRLAASIARFAPSPERDAAASLARRWATGGQPPEIKPSPPPENLGVGDREPFRTDPPDERPPALEGIVPTPLAATTLPIAAPWANQSDRTVTRRAYWALPAILDSLTVVNDGEAITAYDRFTLRPRWQYPPNLAAPIDQTTRDADRSRGRTRLIEDPATVTASGDRILAPMGNVINGRREGEPTVVCLDRDTGRVRWRVRPDTLHPDLADASVRGPVTVHNDTALIMLRRNERSRRTIATTLAALDLDTGRLRWHRFLGAVGALPYQQQTRSPQAVSVIDGVACVVDEIGLVAAVSAVDGRPLWVRRTAPLPPENNTTPWALHAAVRAAPGTIAAISPDRSALLAIDLESGTVTASRPSPAGGNPSYLLPLPGTIALVDATGITRFDPADISRSAGRRLEIPASRAPILGRAIATADRVYAPVEGGVIAFPLDDSPPALIPLDHSGNIGLAEGQLIAADDTRVRAYLAWDTAAEILQKRAREQPANPEHAVSFAELAYRAGRVDELIDAIDQAIGAVNRAAPNESNRAVAARLFDSVLEMVSVAQSLRNEQAAGLRDTPALSIETVDALIARLDRLADSPAQRVAHLLAQGRQHELAARAREAVETYQQILADEVLAATPWRGRRLNIRAEIEATRRLLETARRFGPGAYEPFALEADTRLAAATEGIADPGELGRIAERYPLATASIRARLAQADALAVTDLARDALIAGNAAIDTIRRQQNAGIPVPGDLIGRAFGVHIAALADNSRIEEAAALLAEFNENHPGTTLRNATGPIDAETLFDTITRRLAARRTGPRLGPEVLPEDEPQLIKGYALRPLARPEPRGVARARYDGTLIVAQQGTSLAWHAPSGDGTLQPVWTRQIDRDPVLLRTDEVSAWIFWPDESGGWLERTDLADGRAMWTSRPWSDLVRGTDWPAGADAANDRFLDPVAGRVRGGEILIATGARTICFIERAGRAVALDAATGRELWARPLPVSQVHDADLAAGVLAVVGSGPDENGTLGPVLATVDPRTGETVNTDDRLPSLPRWVRVTESGEVIAGLADRIVSSAPFDARLNWELSERPLSDTRDAWLLGTELLVRSAEDELWLIDTRSGRLAPEPLETRGRIDTTDRVVVHRTPTRLILAASDGVCVFDNRGELAGLDAFSQPARLLPAVIAENTVAVLKIERGRFGIGGTRFTVNTLSHESARLTHDATVRLFGDPTDMQGIDGRLLINAGDLTVVIRMPASASDESPAP